LEELVNRPHLKKLSFVLLGVAAVTLGMVDSARAQRKVAAAEMAAPKALGSKAAPITMEVFSDYQCPACGQLYVQTLRLVIDNYVSAGKVYLVHRDFPLPVHKYSRDAARWANAAAEVGKFERVEQALYTKRDSWENSGNIEAVVATVLSPAELKRARVLAQSGKLDSAIEKDIALGGTYKVTQTPTSIVTCRGQTYPIVGVVSYPILRQFFDSLLRQ
jgi:protein-disulfide isomerase